MSRYLEMTCGCPVPLMPLASERIKQGKIRTVCPRHEVSNIWLVKPEYVPHPTQSAQVHRMIALGQDPGRQLVMMKSWKWVLDESAGEQTEQADSARSA